MVYSSVSRDPASITLGLTAKDDRVTLEVRDCGTGFSPEVAESLFEPFALLELTPQIQGSRLNLAKARAIIEASGGQIRAESAGLGNGATFVVECRAAIPRPGESECRQSP